MGSLDHAALSATSSPGVIVLVPFSPVGQSAAMARTAAIASRLHPQCRMRSWTALASSLPGRSGAALKATGVRSRGLAIRSDRPRLGFDGKVVRVQHSVHGADSSPFRTLTISAQSVRQKANGDRAFAVSCLSPARRTRCPHALLSAPTSQPARPDSARFTAASRSPGTALHLNSWVHEAHCCAN